ncbi:MAG: hypothetical protein ACR2NP_07160 [Pirellulaceae bacterium]
MSDRSAAIEQLLRESDAQANKLASRIEKHKQSQTDLGSWVFDVMRFSESIGANLAEEVSEWSVVSTKQI